MEPNGIRLGSFAGAPIILDWTVAFLAGFFIVNGVLNGGLAALPGALIFVAALLVAILAHECGHAGTAALLNIRSSAIVLTFFGGYVSFVNPPQKRWQDIAISAAGPFANLGLAAALYFWAAPALSATLAQNPLLGQFLANALFVNLVLGLFNLLPGYPLDGGAIARSFLSYFLRTARARWIVAWLGVIIATGIGIWSLQSGSFWNAGIGLLLGLTAFAEVNASQAALRGAQRRD